MFDKAFILDRINECKKLITFRLGRAELSLSDDDSDFLNRCLDSYGYWLKCAGPDYSFSESESDLLTADFFHFSSLVLCAHDGDLNAQTVQVLEQAPSRELSVFRVLGKASKFQSLYALNEQRPSPASIPEWAFWPLLSIGWRPSLTVTKRILSHTRPVGGLA